MLRCLLLSAFAIFSLFGSYCSDAAAEINVKQLEQRIECRIPDLSDHPPDAEIRDLQSECVRRSNGLVRHDSDQLVIKNRDGSASIIKENRKACEVDDVDKCKAVYLDCFDESCNFVVLRIRKYESETYMFLYLATKKKYDLSARPDFSPNGDQFVVVDRDELNDREMDFTIYAIDNHGLRNKFRYVSMEFIPKRHENWNFRSWKNENQIILTVSSPAESIPSEKPVTLERKSNGSWRIKDWPR